MKKILMMLAVFGLALVTVKGGYAMDAENTLIIETSKGVVTIGLKPDLAPNHVARIKELAREGFYDGVVFHRVIDGFMAQTGDPTGTGTGSSDKPDLDAEFSDAPYLRGTLGMARSSNPNSANSQFFITFGPTPFLEGEYTVFGQVTDGMNVVDDINKGEPPANPDKMVTVRVAADVEQSGGMDAEGVTPEAVNE